MLTFASPTFPWGIHKYYFKNIFFYNAAQRKETEYLNNCAFTKSTNAGQTQAEKSLMHWLSMKEKGQMKTIHCKRRRDDNQSLLSESLRGVQCQHTSQLTVTYIFNDAGGP